MSEQTIAVVLTAGLISVLCLWVPILDRIAKHYRARRVRKEARQELLTFTHSARLAQEHKRERKTVLL